MISIYKKYPAACPKGNLPQDIAFLALSDSSKEDSKHIHHQGNPYEYILRHRLEPFSQRLFRPGLHLLSRKSLRTYPVEDDSRKKRAKRNDVDRYRIHPRAYGVPALNEDTHSRGYCRNNGHRCLPGQFDLLLQRLDRSLEQVHQRSQSRKEHSHCLLYTSVQ